jgi:DNA-binding GntR family transcriptional regulator
MMSKSEPRAAQIAQTLAERIVSGQLEPGSRLRQDHIAEEFGTSHVPVREAFRRLEAQGLAVSEPRRGVRVASFELAQVREVAEMRAALEGLALRHAGPHITRSILDAAEDVIRQGEAAKDIQAWEIANQRFHRLILEPCGMPRLLAAIDDLHLASAQFLYAAWRPDWEAGGTNKDHRAILAALRQGETAHAVSLLTRHVQRIGKTARKTASGGTQDAFSIIG